MAGQTGVNPAQVLDTITAPVKLGDRFGVFGDSLDRMNDINAANSNVTNTNAFESVGPVRWLNWLAGQRFNMPASYNFGVSGDTTVDMNRRLDPVIAANLTACILGGGTNDLTSGTITKETTLANRQYQAQVLIANGCTVFVRGIPPRQTWGALSLSLVPAAIAARIWLNRQMEAWCDAQDHGRAVYIDLDDTLSRQDWLNGTLTAGGTTSVTLPTGLTKADGSALTDDYFKFWYIRLINGTGLGASRMITGYTASTRVATLIGSSWQTTGPTTLSATGTSNVITRWDGGSFVTDGFEIGAAVTLAGFSVGGNNGNGSITDLTDSTMTVTRSLTTEAQGAGKSVIVTTPTSATAFYLDPYGASRDDCVADGLHWSLRGALLAGQKYNTVITPYAALKAILNKSLGSPYSLLYDPCGNLLRNNRVFGSGATVASPWTGNLAMSWSLVTGAAYSSTGTFAASKEAQTNGSEKQVLAISALTGGANQEKYFFRQALTTGLLNRLVGQTIEGCAEIEVSNVSNINEINLTVIYTNDNAGTGYALIDGRDNWLRGSNIYSQFPTDTIGQVLTLKTPQGVIGDSSLYGTAKSFYLQIEINCNAAAAVAASVTVKVSSAELRVVPS